jgi:hypothetical protein
VQDILYIVHLLGIVFHHLASISNQHADCHRIPQNATRSSFPTSSELLDHLRDCHPVLLPDQVQQSEGMILHDIAGALHLTSSGPVAVAAAASSAEVA